MYVRRWFVALLVVGCNAGDSSEEPAAVAKVARW